MKFNEICIPITKELHQLEIELKRISETLGNSSVKEISDYFFMIPGKRLRPTLTFLSAGSINPNFKTTINRELIQLALAIELIHSASLIHDDIIDGDFIRRGQKTLNKTFGNQMAVLFGDALYARAFTIFLKSLPREFGQIMIDVVEKMCLAEIINAKDSLPEKEKYFKIIEGKTALLISACCKLGATIAGAGEKEIKSLEQYGFNLGMAYQLIDDCIDNDPIAIKNSSLKEALEFATNAKLSIKNLEDSPYKKNLIGIIDYLIESFKPKAQNS